ncbi:unnamed protein product [Sphenostylis stenocarpa]|uniref:Uncharacterized protein n=1 Tax=Sphenostylis stenocarpa TaxID=92480 RepID=A0AA86VI72_9FABA|nr:unnamed protein product [Sphenostylis stenocarpa]
MQGVSIRVNDDGEHDDRKEDATEGLGDRWSPLSGWKSSLVFALTHFIISPESSRGSKGKNKEKRGTHLTFQDRVLFYRTSTKKNRGEGESEK